MSRTPEEIQGKIIELARALVRSDCSLNGVCFLVSTQEADDYHHHLLKNNRFTLSGDDGPYGLMANDTRLMFHGIRLVWPGDGV